MTFTVKVLARAENDLREIGRYISRDSEANANAMLRRIVDRVESLSEFPLRGARPRDERLRAKGYRFLVEKPYLLFYKVHESTVTVYRVIHGARAYEKIL